MSVTTWSHIPEEVSEQISIPTPQQPGEVNNRVIGGTLTSIAGQGITEGAIHRVNEQDLAPSSASGMLGTVRNNGGFATTNVTPDSTIEIPGFGRTSVKVAESLGYLTRNGEGRYVETARLGKAEGSPEGGTQEESKEDSQEPDLSQRLFAPAVEKAYGDLIKDVPQGTYDSLLGSSTALLAEGLDLEGIAQYLSPRLASSMGLEPEKAEEMIRKGGGFWQDQADSHVGALGVDPEDFYQWARDNRRSELQQAVNSHLIQRSAKGYTALVNDYFDNTIPTVAALKAGGIPVIEKDGEVKVKLKGHWMTVGAAVKARLV